MMDWIRCDDRLSEQSGRYLVATIKQRRGNRYYYLLDYSAKWWCWNAYDHETQEEAFEDNDLTNDVEYWMPIPEVVEPPVEEVKPHVSQSMYDALVRSVRARNEDPAIMSAWLDDFAERMAV